MTNRFLHAPALVALAFSCAASVFAAQQVTVDNYVRAETDTTMRRYVDEGAFGKFLHLRSLAPIDNQKVIRMNRDTLYSFGIFDLTEPVTIVKPAPGERFQSMIVINEDHSAILVEHGPGEFELTEKRVGTRYVFVAFRTFVDPKDPDDVKAAHALQDEIVAKQKSVGTFEVPDWDQKSLKTVRDAINVLAATRSDTSVYFGDKSKLNPIYHLLGTAYGWGGNPPEGAVTDAVTPEKNDGKTPYTLTVKDVPVKGFWSITVYNQDGFMVKNDLDAYSFNNVTAEKNDGGSVTIHFGGDPKSVNYLPIMPGWNYSVRMYRPSEEIISGSWKFPRAEPSK